MFQCSDGNSAQDNSSLKRVAVVEDFFDIIYAMHVEMGADPGRAPKHAGQKKTYKAVGKSNQVPAGINFASTALSRLSYFVDIDNKLTLLASCIIPSCLRSFIHWVNFLN